MSNRIAIMREGRIVQVGRPRDLYERPRNAFVASFLGEANVFTVSGMRNGHDGLALIETAEGRTIDSSTLAIGFESEGFSMLAPQPDVVLPAIEAELAKITATPRSKSRTRDADKARATAAIRGTSPTTGSCN